MDSELARKVGLLRDVCKANGVKALLIERQNNISWLLRGRSHIGINSVNGACSLVLNDDGLFLVVNNIERERLLTEEFVGAALPVREYNWWDEKGAKPILDELTAGDFTTDGQLEGAIKPLRIILSDEEIGRYRDLSRATADAMEAACLACRPGMTEYEVAALLSGECISRGLDATLALVAADERVLAYRHPLPTTNRLRDYVMLVAVARRDGLHSCITRLVSFGSVPAPLRRKLDAIIDINAYLVASTRPGADLGGIFHGLVERYARNGFADEWRFHHQGGVTGYSPREYKGNFGATLRIAPGQAYAWNPSIAGVKAEDTYVIHADENENLTATPNLPAVESLIGDQRVTTADVLVREKTF